MTEKKFEEMTYQERGVYASNIRLRAYELEKEGRHEESVELHEKAKELDEYSQKLLEEYVERENAKYPTRKANADEFEKRILSLESLYYHLKTELNEMMKFADKTDEDLIIHGGDFGESIYFKILGLCNDSREAGEKFDQMIGKIEKLV